MKTQIQISEEMFEELRAFARRREWSLTETFCRGAELLIQMYPETPEERVTPWTPPSSDTVGWKGLRSDQLREAAFSDGDPLPLQDY